MFRTCGLSLRQTSARFRVGVWHIDGGANPAEVFQRQNANSGIERRMQLIERLPAVTDLLTNVRFDLFAIIGAGPGILSADSFIVPGKHVCVATAPSGNGRGSTFVIAPSPTTPHKRESAGEQMPEWRAEAVPGAGGAHVRATHYTARRGSNNKSGSSSSSSSSPSSSVQLCFLDLEGVDRLALGTRRQGLDAKQRDQSNHHQRYSSNGVDTEEASTDPILFRLDKELQVMRNKPIDVATPLKHETNEIRLSRYLSTVVTSCDIVAGHTRAFRLDAPSVTGAASAPPARSSPSAGAGSSRHDWNDAWRMAGSPPGEEFTFEPNILARKYWAVPSSVTLDKQPRRPDRVYVRESRKISVLNFKTMRWPCVNKHGEKLVASCFNPIIVDMNVNFV